MLIVCILKHDTVRCDGERSEDSGAEMIGSLMIITKQKYKQNYPEGKNKTDLENKRLDWTWQQDTRGTFDSKIAQDCKHRKTK